MLSIFATGEPLMGQEKTFVVKPAVAVGLTASPAVEPFAGFSIEGELHVAHMSASVVYRRTAIGRSCKLSSPPDCSVPVAGGHHAIGRLRRAVGSASKPRLLIGPAIGLARWLDNAEVNHNSYVVVGGSGELQIPVGTGQFGLGAFVDWTRPTTLLGITIGLGWHF